MPMFGTKFITNDALIRDTSWSLMDLFPELVYNSHQTRHNKALQQGVISQQEYDAAKAYYGKGWDYTGD